MTREPHPHHRRRKWIAPIVLGSLVLAACGSDDDSSADAEAGAPAGTEAASTDTAAGDTEPSATDPAATAPATEEDGTEPAADSTGEAVVVGAVLEPTSLDLITTAGAALDQILLDNVYETLLKADETGEIGPGLAELPEVTGDGTVYTFTLPEGVTFHNGEALTAEDVVWSLDQLRAPEATGVDDLASVATVEATDDTTVTVTLTQPDNNFLFNLTRRAGAVLDSGTTELADTANGTGPFVLDEWNVGTSISLATNADYWGDAPAIPGVTFVYFTDANAAVNALTTGDADILTGISSELVEPLQDDDDYVVNQGTTNGEFTLGFNNANGPLADVAVRRAIRQAIDHDGILELNNGFGTLIGGPVPPTDPWYEDLTDVVPYDLEAAKAALAEAGYADGFDLRFVYPNIYSTTIAEYIATQLSEVGINLDIQPVEFSVWLDQVYGSRDYDITVVNHVEPRDIDNYGKDYYWNYDNPEVTTLIADAKVAPTPEEATELLTQAARQIAEDSPVDWLFLGADLTASTANVTGYPVNDTASRFDASDIVVS